MAGKSDLVNSIADSVEGISRKQAVAAFEAIFDAMTDALKAGDTVKVPGFGSFAVSQREARKGRNPATGESITIKASKSVRFKVGKELKESVNVKKKGGRKSA
jgi:DNA-binding protein HU-beta